MGLSDTQLSLLPTEEEVAFYEEHGWYISQPVISDEWFAIALRGIERLYRDDRDTRLPFRTGFQDWKLGDEAVIRNSEFTALQVKELRQFALQPILGAIAARLARTSEIRLLDDQVVYKPPQSHNPVGWHADKAYWSSCSSNRLLTAFVPFQDVNEHNGTLLVLDQSHRWRPEVLQDIRLFNHRDLETIEAQFQAQGNSVKRVPMILKKGQVSFHHCWAVHGSTANASPAPRLAMAIHLQDRDNHYRPFWTSQGEKVRMFDEALCRTLPNGDPDFCDPAVFPVLWSTDEPTV